MTAGLALCLLGIAAAAFYPLVNWWGGREFAKAAAEVKARGLTPPSRVLAVADLPDCFFRQPAFLAEVALPNEKRLGRVHFMEMLPKKTPAFSALPDSKSITADQARSGRDLLAPLAPRRAAVIEAAQRSTPLASVKPHARVLVPKEESRIALRLAGFLEEDATLAKIAGDHDAALESLEAYFRIIRELMETEELEYVFREVDRMIHCAILDPGCSGFSEAQLARIDTLLSEINFPMAFSQPLRELPGICVSIHEEATWTGKPGLGKLPPGLFSTWNWNKTELKYKAGEIWRAWKPFGLHEVEMARQLRTLADMVDGPPTEDRRIALDISAMAAFVRVTAPLNHPRSRQHMNQFALRNSMGNHLVTVVARHLVAFEQHRVRHGELPASLEELDPDLRDRLPAEPKHSRQLLPSAQ